MSEEASRRVRTFAYGLGCWALPVGVLLAALAACGIYPFGPETFLLHDAEYQYGDFFAWYRQVLLGEADPFYSWAQALGGNTWGMVSYYLSSPLNVLVVLFPEDGIAAFFLVSTLVKIGLAQVTCVFYVRRRFGVGRAWACAIALGFSLSMWAITQMRCVMWLDGLVLLPLCAWGACCLIRKRKWKLLTIALAAAIITCWYMAYMIVVFLCLYYVFEVYALAFEGVRLNTRERLRRAALFAGALLFSLALSLWTFLPTVFAMVGGGESEGGSSHLQMALDVISERLPAGIGLEVVFGALVVIAAGVLIAFIALRRFTLRRKAAVLLLVLLALCTAACIAVPALQHGSIIDVMAGLLWGGWLDSKTPQLFGSFLLLGLTCAFFVVRRVPGWLKCALGLFLLLLILSSWLRPLEFIWGGFRVPYGYHSRMSFVFIFMLVWTAGYVVRAFADARVVRSRAWSGAAIAVVAADVLVHALLTLPTLYTGYPYEEYARYNEQAREQAAELEAYDPGIYRVEKTYTRRNVPSYNEGLMLGVNQLSSYSSTSDKAVIAMLTSLGYGDGEFYTYDPEPTLMGDALLGVKYVSAYARPDGFIDTPLAPTPDGAVFYENPYALPLAYGVNPGICELKLEGNERFENLNRFASALTGEDVQVYVPCDGGYDCDEQALRHVIDRLSAAPFEFDVFAGSHIEGTCNASSDMMLLMTIPNQSGWDIQINGAPVQARSVCSGALMALPLQAGENQVAMRFVPPGLIPGSVVSVLALAAFAAIVLYGRKSTRPGFSARVSQTM